MQLVKIQTDNYAEIWVVPLHVRSIYQTNGKAGCVIAMDSGQLVVSSEEIGEVKSRIEEALNA